MSNDFYNHSTYPAPNSAGSSAALRAELDLVTAAFNKMPTLAGNGYKLVGVNAAGTALEADAKLMNVDFSTTATAAGAVGRFTWNDTDGTLDLGLKGGNVTLQLGQEQVVRIYNETAVGFTDLQVVRVTGSSGNRLTADLAQANAEITSASTIAIMTEPAAAHSEGFATTFGLVRQVNTSAFTEGATLYLSPSIAGGITTSRPTAPNHTVILGWCVRSHATQGSIYVNVSNGLEIDELHDVNITSVAAYNMLRRNSANTVWENIAGPSGAIVGTTDTQTLTNKTISGGTVTGAAVTGLSAPSGSSDATTKGYVDAADALKLNLAGGTMSGAIAMNTNRITGMGDPVNPQDATTKAYVDTAVQGLDAKASARVATTANITLSGTQTIDGVALSVGDRVLVKDQTTSSANGIYLVAAGSWTRTTDADTWAELVSAFVFVEQGTANGNNGYTCTVAAGGTLGSTAVTWVQFSGAGQITAGAGMTKTGNTLDVGTASSSRIVVNADNIDLATTGVTAGTYKSVTVDAYGRVTAGTNPTTLAGFGITDAYTKTEMDTSLATKLNLSGGTMTGNIAMGGYKVTGLGAPTSDNDAVRLIYVTTLFGSTSSAAASAAAALVSQNAAAASASAASTSEGNALTYKNAASASASAASTSETNAAASAASAAASYDSFDDRYLGPKSTAPAVDNDGNPLLVGALYFDTTISSMRVYDGSLWMSAGSSVNGTSRRYRYIATAGQTTFTGVDSNGATLAYDPLYIDVYFNGSRLDSSDYTATSGSSIVLAAACSLNDEVNIVAFGTFSVATHVLKSGDTMTGLLTVPSLVSTGNVGIGTGSPSNTLSVYGSTAPVIALQNSTTGQTSSDGLQFYVVGSTGYIDFKENGSLNFWTNGSERMQLNASGNLGLGVTPSAWSLIKAFQLPSGVYLGSYTGSATPNLYLGANNYFNGTNFIYSGSYAATKYEQTTGAHAWYTAPSGTAGNPITFTQAMTLDASGNLGVGTTSPSYRLDIDKGSAGIVAKFKGGTKPAYIYSDDNAVYFCSDTSVATAFGCNETSDLLTFYTGNAERARIDSSGNLTMRVGNLGTITNSPTTFVGFYGSQSNGQAATLGTIYGISPGSWGGALVFTTKSADGNPGDTQVERARIDSSGNLLLGTTTGNSAGCRMLMSGDSGAHSWQVGPNSAGLYFYVMNSSNVGVVLNNGATSWSTQSDERLKTQLTPFENATQKVCTLRTGIGRYLTDDESVRRSFLIAQDVQAVLPEAVDVQLDEQGTLGLRYQDLIPLLTAAIQEQQTIIEQLKADVAALKGA